MSALLIARLIEAGTPAALVAEVAMELGKAQASVEAVETRRAKDRERKRIDNAFPRNSTESMEATEFPEAKEKSPIPPKENTPLSTPKGVTPQAEKRPSRLPDDFKVPDDWLEWAMTKRLWGRGAAEEEAESFCLYWQAKGKDAAKRSWKKTWQNWVINSRRPNGQIGFNGQRTEGSNYDRDFLRRRYGSQAA